MGLTEFLKDDFGIVGIACRKIAVGVGLFDLCLEESRYGLVPVVDPWVAVSPVSLEVCLYFPHLFAYGLLGIALHAGIECGVNLQTIGIRVEFGRHIPQFVEDSLPEIERLSVVGILDREAEFDGKVLQTVTLGACKMPVRIHIVDNGVATPQGILGVDFRIVGCSGLEQSDEHGGLFHRKVLGRGTEVGLCGSLNAVGV